MLIPILMAVPAVVHLAEDLFIKPDNAAADAPGTGADKKAFVLDAIGKLFDDLAAQKKVPFWLSKNLVLALSSTLIEILVPKLTA